MSTIYLGLGSNLGDKKKYIEQAITLLQQKVTHIVRATLYKTKPVGFEKQDNFYNTVIKGETNLTPEELLIFVKKIEKEAGRKIRFKNDPREIDIDILLYDNLVLNSENLIIPHPRMHERDFVLKPMSDISPDIIHPVNKKTIIELLESIPKKERSIISPIVG